MNAKELRKKYIQFFESKGHLLHDSAPLTPIDATGKLDESLLYTGAGMVQFKPYFRGIAKPPHSRLVNSQKCVRAVDIEEVGNPSHLTFFEMLGNFSFGDYFKKEAIEYAWEFLSSTQWLGIDMSKVCVTIYEEDDEAYAYWEELWTSNGFDSTKKIHRLSEDKNYWPAGAFSSGPPGPCGTCSEIFYQTVPDSQMIGDYVADDAAGHWLEIWNLVFMQYEWKGVLIDSDKPHLGYKKIGLEPLPSPCIDTGSGLERTATVLGGFSSVYETDVFAPIVSRICEIANYSFGSDSEKDRVVRIIADHIRTASFCICDGILPSNSGRGYVLRRLIRRSVLKGQRTLGLSKPFLTSIYSSVIEALGDPYLELRERKDVIAKTLQNEEELFLRTVNQGISQFAALIETGNFHSVFPGEEAFFLYDTFGFPLEVTEELSAEKNLIVDKDGFERAMNEAQSKSRKAHGSSELFAEKEDLVLAIAKNANAQSEFVGYELTECNANLVQISPRFGQDDLTNGMFQICLDHTPFYAESGGQVGDTGAVSSSTFEFEITNTWIELGLIWHDAKLISLNTSDSSVKSLVGLTTEEIGPKLHSGLFFSPVTAKVNAQRRQDIIRNHTATHLLHAALRDVLGSHVAQAGSLVAPDRLRFDFTHGEALKQSEIESVEQIVNDRISDAMQVAIHNNVSIDDARKRGAMMLFGEKYGAKVRMVDIEPFSLELCGGCHVKNSSEIGLFKITSEASSASGVRRIEAVTGRNAYVWVKERDSLLKSSAKTLKVNPNDILKAIDKLQENIKELKKDNERLLSAAPTNAQTVEPRNVLGINLYVQKVSFGGSAAGKLATERLIENDPFGVAVVGIEDDGNISFFCKVGIEALILGAHAGNLVREVAKVTGGGGGGSPTFAQAGGKDLASIDEALASVEKFLILQKTD